MLLERPPQRWSARERARYQEYAEAVEAASGGRSRGGSWASSREVYVAFYDREPSGYPDPMPRFVRMLKEAARGDFFDGRWNDQRRGFEWRPR